ncbi:MAG: DNA gyrase inhibitor YacG [Rhodospirillales bacterium 69-11]|nr:DNA gyrase inhibitor YacG [Rhodospirillales bacterium]OJW26111.1 MAG: DNA gyrase inhibitor YacG [Rhodospirillales bacterium 69-11]
MAEPRPHVRCAICGKPVHPSHRPFCSPRCAEVDLGRWLTGQYRIPGPPAELEEDSPPST